MRSACRAAITKLRRSTLHRRPRCARRQFRDPLTAPRRTATITIDKGETLQSLATKINIQMQTYGKASVNYTGGAAGLKIAVNPGVTLSLVAGPKDFDALARLGIAAGTLTSPSTTKTTGTSTATAATQAFGLGLSSTMNLSTKVGADVARGQLLGVLSALQTAYQKTNTPPAPVQGPGITGGTVSPYLADAIVEYTLALNMPGGLRLTQSA